MYLVWGWHGGRRQEGGPGKLNAELGSTELGRRQTDPGVQEAEHEVTTGTSRGGSLPLSQSHHARGRFRSVLRNLHAGPTAAF